LSTDREQDGEVAPEAQLRNESGRKVVSPDVDEEEHLDDGSGLTDPVGSAGPTEVSELVGWQPDFPPRPQRTIPDGLTVGMTDQKILAHYRDSHRNGVFPHPVTGEW
jgi:hypothetical protein